MFVIIPNALGPGRGVPCLGIRFSGKTIHSSMRPLTATTRRGSRARRRTKQTELTSFMLITPAPLQIRYEVMWRTTPTTAELGVKILWHQGPRGSRLELEPDFDSRFKSPPGRLSLENFLLGGRESDGDGTPITAEVLHRLTTTRQTDSPSDVDATAISRYNQALVPQPLSASASACGLPTAVGKEEVENAFRLDFYEVQFGFRKRLIKPK
ncbi:hypothetical protein B0H14DRAFT_2616293 [Mycena olivaceomarginata]|nr:hypothetical protein B0H14DRAFT_2616293 [Mycena olivaceomarginata]